MERFGITRADLGVVPHGLRHQGAADDDKAMTGEAPPVAGGQPVDRKTDAAARQCIAQRLGHNRQTRCGRERGAYFSRRQTRNQMVLSGNHCASNITRSNRLWRRFGGRASGSATNLMRSLGN